MIWCNEANICFIKSKTNSLLGGRAKWGKRTCWAGAIQMRISWILSKHIMNFWDWFDNCDDYTSLHTLKALGGAGT